MTEPNIRDVVKEKYGSAALRVTTGGSSCCGATPATSCGCDPITSHLYDAAQSGQIPAEAMLASLGCGNPTAFAKLNAGETVLDLGSGGGIDVLLSARRVGPTGKAYGLDMTDEMLALANEKLWLGHFGLESDDGMPVYRHAILLRGAGGASAESLEDLVDIALTECERFFPAFQFVLWGGKSPAEALAAAMLDCVGEA